MNQQLLGFIIAWCFAGASLFAQEHRNSEETRRVGGMLQYPDAQGTQQALPGALVRYTDRVSGSILYGTTNSLGFFDLPVGSQGGDLEVLPRQLMYYFDTVFQYVIPSGGGNLFYDLVAPGHTHCPLLYVDISTPYLEVCQPSYYAVSYRNEGTATASDAYVEVRLDEFMSVDSSQAPYTNLGQNVYRFDLGNVPPGASGNFRFYIRLDCQTPSGRTHCVEAHIYPDEVCDSLWNGARLQVQAQCTGDSVVFHIYNGGLINYPACPYIVIEDDIMLRQGTFGISAGQTVSLSQAASLGHVYRFEALQQQGFPSFLGDPVAAVTVQGCGNFNGMFQPGLVTQFSNGNSSPFIAVDCSINDLFLDRIQHQGFPTGYGTEAYIYPYTDMDYHTVVRITPGSGEVVLLDTLSPHLELRSLEPGASSHPYAWSIEGPGVLSFRLQTGNTTDTLAFVKYRLRQRPGNESGTRIVSQIVCRSEQDPQGRRSAPVVRTVSDHFLRVLMSDQNWVSAAGQWSCAPLPLSAGGAWLSFSETLPQGARLYLYDAWGRLLWSEALAGAGPWRLERGRFPAEGCYLYRVSDGEGRLLARGKLPVR